MRPLLPDDRREDPPHFLENAVVSVPMKSIGQPQVCTRCGVGLLRTTSIVGRTQYQRCSNPACRGRAMIVRRRRR